MIYFWSSIVHPILRYMKPSTIIEVGCAQGLNTLNLLSYAQSHDSKLIAIDPAPQFDVTLVKQVYGQSFDLKEGYSLQVLPEIETADVVFLDGDHNWYTVYHELKLLEKLERFPLVFLHDTEWPYARRDMYYFPESIPPSYRHPHARKGILPDINELVDGGHNESVWNAAYENGPRNGVLTAVEDFLAETKLTLRLHRAHSQHGLSIIMPNETVQEREHNDKVQQIVAASGL